ncbi:dipeptide/oligopeptide/nickel ABC transporter ATP-binding protein [Clostridium oceanicum]|uniref:ATP-binding cassette domain-containing protein n=1 Tax=Clostridium oceanicum TaxID=1543 RepID=A0ABP3UH15_9CLOT
MIKIKHLLKEYGNNTILKDISFHLKPNKSLAIVGESGSGKSTIANIMLGFEICDKGEIVYKGKSLKSFNKKDWKLYRNNIQPVFQDSKDSLNPRMKIKDIISEPLKNFTLIDKEQRYKRVKNVLQLIGLNKEEGEKYPYAFSTGQQKRINLARAVICNPKVIILDEVTSGLDPKVKNNIIKLIKKLQRHQNITFVIITHDISIAEKLASHIIVLKEGQVVEEVENFKNTDELKSNYSQKLIDAVPKLKYIGGLK